MITMSLNVGVVANELEAEAGGAHTFTDEIVHHLRNRKFKHNFKILPPFMQEDFNWDTRSKLRTVVENLTGIKSSVPPKPYRTAIKNYAPDVVWFVDPPGFMTNVPYFLTVWDLEHRKNPYFPEVSFEGFTWDQRENIYKDMLPRAAGVITGTEVGKSEISKFYGIDKKNIHVINLFPPDYTKINAVRVENLSIGEYLFYPAQFWPHKNHRNLLLALKYLKDEYGIEKQLVLTGSDKGNLDYINILSNELGISNLVVNLGFVKKSEIKFLYENARCLVYPSFFGPDNLPPLEAISLGCPVTSADVPGAREQLMNASLYFDPSNHIQLAECIREITENQNVRLRLIENGISLIKDINSHNYINKVCAIMDSFEPIRRTWITNTSIE